MDGLIGYEGQGVAEQRYDSSPKMAHVPTMKQRLEMAVKHAEEKLAAAKRARELFDKNPDLEELLNILQRGNF
jgi:hypothetical protein